MVKKLIQILLVLAAGLCTTPMRGDSPDDYLTDIPVKKVCRYPTSRDFQISQLNACYDCMLSSIFTTVSDLGEIEMTVTNCSTGEVWYDTFDSSSHTQHVLAISGTPGLYEVTYTTSCGDLYEGVFIIE